MNHSTILNSTELVKFNSNFSPIYSSLIKTSDIEKLVNAIHVCHNKGLLVILFLNKCSLKSQIKSKTENPISIPERTAESAV